MLKKSAAAPELVLAFILGLILAPVAAFAQSKSSFSIGGFKFDFSDPALAPSTDAHQRFLSSYRAARASGDPAVMRNLVHSAAKACMTGTVASAYFDERMKKEVDAKLPDDAAILFAPIPAGFALMPSTPGVPAPTVLPVSPTLFFAADYSHGVFDDKGVLVRSVGRTILRQLAEEGGEWRMVEYCLTPNGQDLFAKRNATRAPAAPN